MLLSADASTAHGKRPHGVICEAPRRFTRDGTSGIAAAAAADLASFVKGAWRD